MLRKLLLSFITVVSSLFWGYGCGDGKDNAYWQKYSRETIGRIINQPVNMPNSIPVCYPDSDAYMQLMGAPAKVLFSVDIGCSACLSKFNYWDKFINQLEQKHGVKAPVLAVIFAANCNDDTRKFINERWHHEWIYDPEGDFTFNNDLDDDRFQAVLLDANDTIRLVGNPVFNESLGRLYEKAIIERLR